MDFGGTLDADGSPWVDRFFALYRWAGGRHGFDGFAQAYAASDRALLSMPGVASLNYSETVGAQADLLAANLPDAARLRSASVRARFVDDAMRIAERNRHVLAALGDDFRLGVVSNYQGNLQPCLDELGIGDLFDAVSDSEVVGSRKPERRIFEQTLGELDCDADVSWMIGDNPYNDIAPAAALGMTTCWIAPAAREAPGVAPTARVTRFDRIPLLVAR